MSAPHIVTLRERLIALITHDGPMTVAQYMGAALYDPMSGYYARRAMLGADGDFITAPEISQMFGELVGLWCAQCWLDLASPAPFHLVELGPGTGALICDIWRATAIAPGFHDAAQISLVEVSTPMRDRQATTIATATIAAAKMPAEMNPAAVMPAAMPATKMPVATWVSRLEEVAAGPALIIGNEFLDCLPVRQFVRTRDGWRERLVGVGADGALAFGLAPDVVVDDRVIPVALRQAPEGSVAEVAPALAVFVAQLAARLRTQGGRALFIDYGAATTVAGDSLQAVRAHTRVDPLEAPGGADLTAHVDFATLAALARSAGLDVAGPVAQGAWLKVLGIDVRAAALSRAQPQQAQTIARQHARLTQNDAMGALFQVICLSAPDLKTPAGFET